MEHTNHANLPVGTPVHVEFDGEVYHVSEHASSNVQPSPNHIAVSDGSYIHHVHVNSDSLTVPPKPKPEFALGQVYRAEGRNYVVYEEVDFADGGFRWYLCGPRDSSGACTLNGSELYERYPDAALLISPDGSVPELSELGF